LESLGLRRVVVADLCSGLDVDRRRLFCSRSLSELLGSANSPRGLGSRAANPGRSRAISEAVGMNASLRNMIGWPGLDRREAPAGCRSRSEVGGRRSEG